ncbi:MAG: cytochrome P450, partial [Polyangiaceae bacterium]|nr:cytochrome P450 [Polyangiaceae bacterium]
SAHARQRKLLAPAFAPKRIAQYSAVMVDGAERAAAGWCDGQKIDAAAELMRMTLEIAARVLFDAEIGFEATEFGSALTVAMHQVLDSGNALLPVPAHWPTPGNLRLRRAVSRLDQTVARIVDERRRSPCDRGDVLSVLLAARDDNGDSMTDRLLRDEVMTLLLAGHETTANALSWCVYRLARDPAVRERVENEVDAVVGERAPTHEDLPRLPFLEAVLKETMRLHPPAYLVGRYTLRDLRLGDAFLPAGTLALVNIYGIHRSARYYADPLVFSPTRFLAENEAGIPKRAYLPFGTGPRTCVGNHFAMLEGKLALASIVRQVRLRLDTSTVDVDPLLTLRPRGGLPVCIERRLERKSDVP